VIVTVSEIAIITGGTIAGDPDLTVSEIITDSRNLNYSDDLAFIAIKGLHHDGHSFIGHLYSRGIRIFIVSNLPDKSEKMAGSAFVITADTVDALHKLAGYARKQFANTVIGITGSAGKTVVKEWLADIIGVSVPVVRSPKSYNSQIGVPLSLLRLDNKYEYGIFEAGISKPGEMARLAVIMEPDVGVITNIGDAHDENFPDKEAKASEKLKLFAGASSIVYCTDHDLIRKAILNDSCLRSKRLTGWSYSNAGADIFVRKMSADNGSTHAEVIYRDKEYRFTIPFSDRASVENATTVIAVCLAIGLDPDIISEGIPGLVSVAMRMEMKSGINNCHLIEDYYNSDPGSLGMALEYLKSQQNRKTTLILSDFVQSGRNESELYSEVADLVRRAGIERFTGIGEALSRNGRAFGDNARFFWSTDEFIQRFNPSDYRDETILLKGARIYEFEKIGGLLEQQIHSTLLEINLDAILHNLNEFRKIIKKGTRIMAMVKAFAYGAGASEIAGLLEYHRVSCFAVACAEEGVELRKSGIALPVIVMNPDPAAFEQMIRNNLEPELYSFTSFHKFLRTAIKHGLISYPVHIKIDSGMHRLGFMPDDIEELTPLIANSEHIRVISVFSHLAASEDPSLDSFTRKQARVFLDSAERIKKAAGYPVLIHLLNSSGIVRFPEYHFDMVRPGIGLYGAGPSNGLDLKPAGSFTTRISQLKRIPAGEPVGYNCSDISDSERIIAILPVGYADGLSRKLGNRRGTLFIRGERAPLTGSICMDMCMADVTGLGAEEGDQAEIFGSNISIEEVASLCDTIPYEILTSIPSRVKRVFYRE